jgi:hypothetical protein
MRRYVVTANYIRLKDNDHNKGVMMYIDGRPKKSGNIARIINSTRPRTTRKKPNCIFDGHEGNQILLTGEIDRPSTGRVEPVRGCLITQAVWDEPP